MGKKSRGVMQMMVSSGGSPSARPGARSDGGRPEHGKSLLSKLKDAIDSRRLSFFKLEQNAVHRGPQTPDVWGVGDKLPSSGLSGSGMGSVTTALNKMQKRGWELMGVLCLAERVFLGNGVAPSLPPPRTHTSLSTPHSPPTRAVGAH